VGKLFIYPTVQGVQNLRNADCLKNQHQKHRQVNKLLSRQSQRIDAFDFLVVVFLNVGTFFRKTRSQVGRLGAREPEFYTFPASFIRNYHDA
jgi:hypothetical protein